MVFHISIWGAWKFIWGLSPPWQRDWHNPISSYHLESY